MRSKVSLRVSPAALTAQGKRVLAEKIAAGELFRQADRGGFLFMSDLNIRDLYLAPPEAGIKE